MTEFLSSLPPVPRGLLIGFGCLFGYLLLVEIGLAPIIGGVIAFAWLTSSQGWPPVGAGFAAGAGTLLLWVVLSVAKPNAPCWWCKGQPKRGMTERGRWRGCLVCGGSGRRHPLGSKVLRRNRRFLGIGGGGD